MTIDKLREELFKLINNYNFRHELQKKEKTKKSGGRMRRFLDRNKPRFLVNIEIYCIRNYIWWLRLKC